MTEKTSKNSDRMIETASIRDGHVEQTDEFWSAESLRRRPITEQYPKLKNETATHYADRLQEIQTLTALAQADLSEEDKQSIEKGAYTEKSGKAIVPNYRKIGMTALQTFDMAKKNPDLFRSDLEKFGFERQQVQEEKADFYVKAYQRKQPELSEFSGLVPDYQLTHDQSSLQKKERLITSRSEEQDQEEREKNKRMEAWNRVAEAILYPLTLNFGLFDYNIANPGDGPSGQYRARALYPSKYDDQFHGVDAAFMVPANVNKDGTIQYAPITFDCTTSTMLKKVSSKLHAVNNDGRTRTDYAKTEDDDLITGIRPLNFIIGIEHASLIGEHGLMKGDNIAHAPRTFVHDIYAQIYLQARLRFDHYRVLQCERSESKDTKLVDILSKEELADARQTITVRDFFGHKCEETATDREHPFRLSRAYDGFSPVLLVCQETTQLLRAQRDDIEKIKKQKGWT